MIRVAWNGILSDYILAVNGVKPGSVLSPIIFSVYIDGLFVRLMILQCLHLVSLCTAASSKWKTFTFHEQFTHQDVSSRDSIIFEGCRWRTRWRHYVAKRPRQWYISLTTQHSFSYTGTPCPKKGATIFSTITLAYLGGFFIILYHWKQESLLHNHM